MARQIGKDTLLGFYSVESKPDEKGERDDVSEFKKAVANIAAKLPEMLDIYRHDNWKPRCAVVQRSRYVFA
jgi:hypothetical protein